MNGQSKQNERENNSNNGEATIIHRATSTSHTTARINLLANQ